jgi:hypothetical protein
MRALYDNEVMALTSGNLTASVEHDNYPAENLLDTRISKYWKTTEASTANIVIDMQATVDCTCIGLVGHNLTASGTAVIHGHTSDSWASPDFTMTVTTRVGGPMLLFFGATQSYRYWKLELTDATVGAFEVGIIYLGDYVQFDPSSRPTFPESRIRNDIVQFSEGGQQYADEGVQIIEYEFEIPHCTATAKTNIQTMYSTVGKHTPIIMAHYDTTYGVIEPLYCVIRDDIVFEHLPRDYWKYNIAFRECK